MYEKKNDYDKTDMKLLYELEKNSRQSLSEIAKSLRLSKQAVKYRMDKLMREGVILNYYAIINTARLGYNTNKIYIQLKQTDQAALKSIIDYFKAHKSVAWVARVNGMFDLIIGIFSRNMVELDNFISDITENFSANINRKTITTSVYFYHNRKSYLIGKAPPKEVETTFFGLSDDSLRYDEKDSIILSMLSKNSRESILNIASKAKLGSEMASKRIKNLEKIKLISGYGVLINKYAIGYASYKLLLKLNDFTRKKEKDFLAYLKVNPNVIDAIKTIGEWDFELDIEIGSEKEFHLFLENLRNRFPMLIAEHLVLIVFDEYKYDLWPF